MPSGARCPRACAAPRKAGKGFRQRFWSLEGREMRLSRKMRQKIRHMTRKQLLAYIFLDTEARRSVVAGEGSVAKFSKWELGNLIISWGYVGTPRDFYKKTEAAKVVARSQSEDFDRFYVENTDFSKAAPEDRKLWERRGKRS